MKICLYHDDVDVELFEATEWYDKKQPGLGYDIRKAFENALQSIQSNSLQFAVEDDCGIRICPLKRFPYQIVYVDYPEYIWLIAFAHERQRYGYWKRRVS